MLLNNRGFSLVEIVVSLLVFAAVSLGGWAMFGAATKAKMVSNDKVAAFAIANMIVETAKMEPALDLEWTQDNERFRAEYTVIPPMVKAEVFYASGGKSIVKIVTARE